MHPKPCDPVVILVAPQLAENIGACARAMGNGGLFRLRLVAPRDGWPQPRAWPCAAGADAILEAAEVFPDVESAIADLHRVFATCPRHHHCITPLLTARGAAAEARAIADRGLGTGVLFGPERAGLTSEDVARADALVRYPVNPAFSSLNLSQAVMVFAYEWWLAGNPAPLPYLMTHETRIATKGALENFLSHLTSELDAAGFLRNREKRPGMVRTIRHLFVRGEATEQELATLHGIVVALAGRKARCDARSSDPRSPDPRGAGRQGAGRTRRAESARGLTAPSRAPYSALTAGNVEGAAAPRPPRVARPTGAITSPITGTRKG